MIPILSQANLDPLRTISNIMLFNGEKVCVFKAMLTPRGRQCKTGKRKQSYVDGLRRPKSFVCIAAVFVVKFVTVE